MQQFRRAWARAQESIVITALALGLASPVLAGGGVFTVTKTADTADGTCDADCSLREALTAANSGVGGQDLIQFAIPEGDCSAAGVCEILVDSDLPALIEAVAIDGTSQSRYGTAPDNVCATPYAPSYMRVQVTATGNFNLFDIQGAEASVIRGLSLGSQGSTTIGIKVSSSAVGNKIQCNHIGVDGEGGAAPDPLDYGVLISGSAIVGTDGDGIDDLAERNVFGGGGDGVYKNVGSGNRISGNYFGVGADGITPLPMGASCIVVRQSGGDNLVGSDFDGVSDHLEHNVVADCLWSGIVVSGTTGFTGNVVAGNWIGVNAAGDPGSAPLDWGIEIQGDSPDILIRRNRIEGAVVGLEIDDLNGGGSVLAGSTGNCIRGNTDGVIHASTGDADLTGNWWGDPSGPSGDGAGSGDPVSDTGAGTLDFSAWLTSEPVSCVGLTILVEGFEDGDVCGWSSASGSSDDCTPPPSPLDCPCVGTEASTVGDLWSYGCVVYEDAYEFVFDPAYDILTTGVGGDGRCALMIRRSDGVAFCAQGGGSWGGDGTSMTAASPELAACRDFLINFPCTSGDTALSCAQGL